jgi:putative oxidoreductase
MSTDVIATHPRRVARQDGIRYLAPAGRVLFAGIFLLSTLGHFSNETIAYAASNGVPVAHVAVPVAGLMAFLGGMSVALGYRTRIGVWLLIAFLVPVTLMLHRFWGPLDPAVAEMQRIHFLKNMSILGGALLLAYFGAGPFSIDAARKAPSVVQGPYPARY